jgi:uncharacterized protein GlcG (DUF336 family)
MKHGVARATLSTGAIQQLIVGALERAAELDVAIHVAIHDAAGDLVGFASCEGALRIAAETARRKAFTAVNTRMSTLAWGRYVDSIPEQERRIIDSIEGYIGADGGFPLYEEGLLLGGIGVSGADQERDADVARAAMARAGIEEVEG